MPFCLEEKLAYSRGFFALEHMKHSCVPCGYLWPVLRVWSDCDTIVCTGGCILYGSTVIGMVRVCGVPSPSTHMSVYVRCLINDMYDLRYVFRISVHGFGCTDRRQT